MPIYEVELEDGSIYEVETEDAQASHPLADTPVWKAGVTVPASSYRSAFRGLAPGGETPSQGFDRGVNATGEDLIRRAQPISVRTPLSSAPRTTGDYLQQFLTGINPAQRTADFVAKTTMETAANTATNPIEGLLALIPGTQGRAIGNEAKAMASRVGEGIYDTEQMIRKIPKVFTKKPPISFGELSTLPESQVAKLPDLERSIYLKLQSQRTSRMLAEKRTALAQEYQEVVTGLKEAERAVVKSMPSVAAKRLERLHGPFRALSKQQGEVYRQGIDDAIANAETAGGNITFNSEEINQALSNKYLRPSVGGNPVIGMEDPLQYQAMTEMLAREGITNVNEIPARKMLALADKYRTAKALPGPMTPQEVISQHLRDVLLDLLEQKGVDVSGPKSEWAKWVPVRDLGWRLQKPSGPSQLIRIIGGKDPVRAKHLESLEALTHQKLDTETRKLFDQLDSIRQQKVIEGAKKLESQRLLQERSGLEKTSQLSTNLRMEQQARHHNLIRELVGKAAAAAAQAVGAYGAYRVGKGLFDFFGNSDG